MTKLEYLSRLRARLAQMPPEERERQLAYYEELFADMTEDGMSEEEAAERLGDPDVVANELLAELPMTQLVKSRVRPAGGWTALTVLLLVLGAPLWLPLLLAAAAVIFALFVTFWALGLSLVATLFGLGLGGLGLFVGTVTGAATPPLLLALGFGLAGAGLLVLSVLLAGWLGRGIWRLCGRIWRGCKSLLIKKEG